MKVKNLVWEDFVQYKKPSMFIGTTTCTWKCLKDLNLPINICQNCKLSQSPTIDIKDNVLIERYLSNPITNSIVIGGLEPLDTFDEVISFISLLRLNKCDDDVVIYTGYYEYEILNELDKLKKFKNIIVKFGRFIPDKEKVYDEVLGIYLASENQFAKKIS